MLLPGDPADPYLHSNWTDPIAYVYSPAFLQLVSPLTALPWQAFMAVWTAILIGAVWYLCGPRFFALGLLIGAMEIAGGNIHLLETVAIVVGFRFPAAWAFVLLTKISPGVGLLWFAVRREWRSLAIALGATAAIVAISFVFMPAAWRQWVDVLTNVAGRDGTGRPCRSRSSSACRSPSRSSSGAPGQTGSGPCRSPR